MLQRLVPLAVLIGIDCGAGISTLTTDASGSVLYFSSDLIPSGSGAASQERIYRWNREQGLQVYLSRDREIAARNPPGSPKTWMMTNNFRFFSPSVSSDGRLLAVSAQADCISCGLIGTPAATAEALVTGSGGEARYHASTLRAWAQQVAISRNGEFLAVYGIFAGTHGFFSPGISSAASLEGGPPLPVSSLVNGFNYEKPFANVPGARVLSDTGLAAGLTTQSRVFVADSTSRSVREVPGSQAMAPSISPDGSWILYE